MNTKIILEVFVEDENKQHRILAVQRFESGESPEAICISLGKSKAWLYKWVGRHLENDTDWNEARSGRPTPTPQRTPSEIIEIIKMVRLNLYNQDLFCGAQAISERWKILAPSRCRRSGRSTGFSPRTS